MTTNNFPGIGNLTYGHAHNYFNKITVTWAGFGSNSVDGYQPDAVINLPEPTSTVIFTNLSSFNPSATGNVLEYSFDGQTVHGELGSSIDNVSLTFQNRVISCIWFRTQAGSASSIMVSIQAWGIR